MTLRLRRWPITRLSVCMHAHAGHIVGVSFSHGAGRRRGGVYNLLGFVPVLKLSCDRAELIHFYKNRARGDISTKRA